jgi:hypothetical protein
MHADGWQSWQSWTGKKRKGYTVDAVQIVAKKGEVGTVGDADPTHASRVIHYILRSVRSENFGTMIISMYQAAMANETTTHLHFY